MDLDLDQRTTDQGSSTAQSGEENASTSSRTKNQRPSSPDFTSPSPEMPAWLSKCLRLLAVHNDEAADELGRMVDEALARRESSEAIQILNVPNTTAAKAGVPAARLGPPKPVAAPLPKKADPGKPKPVMPAKTEGPPPKKMKQSPGSSPAVSPAHNRSPEYALPATTLAVIPGLEGEVLSSGTSFAPLDSAVDDSEVTDLSALLGGYDGCVVCGQITEPDGNVLLKCNDCQRPFHQLCHRPAVFEANTDDPRFVWYCAACKSKIKNTSDRVDIVLTPKVVPSVPAPKFKAEKGQSVSATPSALQLFKRTESKSTPAVATAILSGAGGGLAQMAASFGKTAKTRDQKIDAKRVRLIDPPNPPRKH